MNATSRTHANRLGGFGRWSSKRLATLGVGLLASLGVVSEVKAEGSRDLFPSGYTGGRANLDLQPAQTYATVIRRRTFLYVYAQAGEYILLGSSNRINGNTAGDIRVYNPQSFGTQGDETIPGTSDFDCEAGATGGAAGPHFFGDPAGATPPTGAITTRLQELAGPRSADNSAGGANTWTPCAYRAPSTGIYGVLFAISDGGAGPNAVIDPPARSNNSVAAWEVTVRANATTTADTAGRVFSYVFAFFTGGNGVARRINTDFFYVTLDGYRYRQEFRDFDPNGYAVYANSFGFLDNGQPLYKDVRGPDANMNTFRPLGLGVVAQPAQYPAFFVSVDGSGPNAVAVNQVLTALSIPTTPPVGALNSASFSGTIGSGQTTVNQGGTFTLNTTNTISFQIVISRDGVDFDPANASNRVLTGQAPGGDVVVAWNGLDNAGVAFPVGTYDYRVSGRSGEVHFPTLDAEGNVSGGPTITRLNGTGTLAERQIVYFDDRGYVTSNATAVGVLNGTVCPAGSGGTPPSPNHNLVGVASTGAYRSWPGNGNDNADCTVATATQGFGDAKGLDLWTHVSSATINEVVEIFASATDLAVTKSNSTASVMTGEDTTYTLTVTNNGPGNANDAVLTDTPSAGLVVTAVNCISVTGGAICPVPPALSVANLIGGGVAIPILPAGSTITFQVVANVTATGLP